MNAKQAKTDAREVAAWKYAVRSQGYDGTYEQWLALDADERAEYETGAQGVGTV